MGHFLHSSLLFYLPFVLDGPVGIRNSHDHCIFCLLCPSLQINGLGGLLLDKCADYCFYNDDLAVRVYVFCVIPGFFIGNIQKRVGFFTLYSIHLLTTIIAINYELITRNPVFISQLPLCL